MLGEARGREPEDTGSSARDAHWYVDATRLVGSGVSAGQTYRDSKASVPAAEAPLLDPPLTAMAARGADRFTALP